MNCCYPAIKLILFALLSLAASSDGFVALQKSVFNYNTADLALDSDPKTCAETGYDLGAWWKIDLNDVYTVFGVKLKGSSDAFNVRVGNSSDKLGSREGFFDNSLCYFSLGIDGSTYDLPCRQEIKGRYVSIQVVDPVSIRKLSLCDVQIQYE